MEIFPSDFAFFYKGKPNFQLSLEQVMSLLRDILNEIKAIFVALGIIKENDLTTGS